MRSHSLTPDNAWVRALTAIAHAHAAQNTLSDTATTAATALSAPAPHTPSTTPNKGVREAHTRAAKVQGPKTLLGP